MMSSDAGSRLAVLVVRALAIATMLTSACSGPVIPVTTLGGSCVTDDDCDPGDNCINGACQGDSAGPDGGIVVSGSDAGPAHDGGSDAGPAHDGGSDAGPALDGGEFDGGSIDAGNFDAGSDAGPALDGGEVDAGSIDAGSDAGPALDGGDLDAGSIDAGNVDGGSSGQDGGAADAGPIGPTGGAVDLLDFVLTGDTRPPTCSSAATYPTATFAQIAQAMASMHPQFALDLGDHMYVCSQNAAAAQTQMALYVQGLVGFPVPFFMTMGNHECEGGADCSANPTDANYAAFIAALAQVSHETMPYYALQIQTRFGRASFVFIADDFFDAAAQSWLENTLTDADANSVYTIIVKHHPVTGSRMGPTGPLTVLQSHHYSLILTAHDHNYAHNTTQFGGRSVICGLGGANATHTGYCRVQQKSDGTLLFTQYDINSNPGSSWTVTARQ